MNKYNKNGLEQGPWEDYYSNGKLYSRGNYVNGKLHGLYDRYYSNGKISWRVNYVYGVEHGLSEWYIYSEDIKSRNLEFFL